MSVVEINAVDVPERSGPELEARLAARMGAVEGSPGFEGFELLRPVSGESPQRFGVLDGRSPWRHDGAMATIQIKNVPADTHAVLTRRAAAAHQSLQAYLLDELRSSAESPTLDEVFASLKGVGGGNLSVETAVQTLREDRARR